MNLYVDDQRPCPLGWHPAKTVTDAVRILAESLAGQIPGGLQMVSLDHDIKGSDETFEPVARYLALMPLEARPEVYFHTANPEGERRMREILEAPPVWETEARDG